jgi:hypothetical protein
VTNPYAGNEPYSTAWQQGHDYAANQSLAGTPQTPDFSGWGYDDATTAYVGQVWQEGALAGQQGAGGGAVAGGGAGADGAVQLPTDVAHELANLTGYFPELTAITLAGDPETYAHTNLAIAQIPTESDESIA